jgi:hypothetical protein
MQHQPIPLGHAIQTWAVQLSATIALIAVDVLVRHVTLGWVAT